MNNIDVETIYSNNDSGSWEIFNITSNIDNEQSFLATQSSLKEGEDVKLVSDVRYGIDALYIHGIAGERVIDLNSNNATSGSLHAENTISQPVFDEKIKNIKEKRAASPTKNGVLEMGTGQVNFTEPKATSNNLPVIIFLFGVILIIPVLFVLTLILRLH
ncbi:hypothetical protein NSS79_09995 [Paenibacillus sp. FSL L8-0436]|uniref:hypothetical protein n=1 Tax=Paenibacillus sp. FSL L8-0436 TaxID=2954686 RepID=UPI0031595C75